MSESPLDPRVLREAADRVRAAWRLVAERAPAAIEDRVQQVLKAHEDLASNPNDLTAHRRVAHGLEELEDELRGRSGGTSGFYEAGRLGLIRRMEPVIIRETIDDARVQAHVERYESRARRAHQRLAWFFRRAGVETEDKAELPPWEQPYADFSGSHDHVLDD